MIDISKTVSKLIKKKSPRRWVVCQIKSLVKEGNSYTKRFAVTLGFI